MAISGDTAARPASATVHDASKQIRNMVDEAQCTLSFVATLCGALLTADDSPNIKDPSNLIYVIEEKTEQTNEWLRKIWHAAAGMTVPGVVAAEPAPAAAESDLAECASHAQELEGIIRDVSAALDAIGQGGLLDAAPADEGDREQHNTASQLVDMAARRLRDYDRIPGTDLSIKLRAEAGRRL